MLLSGGVQKFNPYFISFFKSYPISQKISSIAPLKETLDTDSPQSKRRQYARDHYRQESKIHQIQGCDKSTCSDSATMYNND